jgi:hypothetical protein
MRTKLMALVFLIGALLVISSAHAQCVSSSSPPNTASAISLMPGSGWQSYEFMEIAAGMWNGCGASGTGFPAINFNGFGTITVTVNYLAGNSGMNACGAIAIEYGPSGEADSGVITVWGASAFTSNCADIMPSVIAHELGHLFGLEHSACNGYIMGTPLAPRSVQGDECNAVDQLWSTPAAPDKPPGEELPECPTSPVMIALSNRYELTRAADGVSFDIDADGQAEQVGWTVGGSDTAFVALDRDGNGRIDDGAELFGDHTPRTDGTIAANGFEALKDLDSNADGRLDVSDAVWHKLLLWRDLDHDGQTDAGETERIADSSIVALGTEYRWTGRRDASGNEFRYFGVLEHMKNSSVRSDRYYDVYLVSR